MAYFTDVGKERNCSHYNKTNSLISVVFWFQALAVPSKIRYPISTKGVYSPAGERKAVK